MNADMKKQRRVIVYQYILIYIFIAVFALPAYAAPSIILAPSSISDGENITISGDEFKTGPTVYKWDQFNQAGDNYDLGDIIANGWTHYERAHYEKPVYSNTNARYAGSKHARMHWWYDDEHSQIHDDSYMYYDGSDGLSSVYVSFYYRRENLNPGNYTDNNKTWRLCSNAADGTGDNPVFLGTRVGYSENSQLYEQVKGCGETILNTDDDQVNNVTLVNGYWQRYEAYVMQSDPGVANGTALTWIQGTDGVFVQEMNHNGDYMFRQEGCTGTWQDYILGGYMRLGHLSGGVTMIDHNIEYESYYDDFYLASSPARIEIGDNAVWENCTKREIQGAINSWNDSAASINVNQGALSSGQAYLFVINENGEVSSGYPITFGTSGGDATAPSTPSGLSIS